MTERIRDSLVLPLDPLSFSSTSLFLILFPWKEASSCSLWHLDFLPSGQDFLEERRGASQSLCLSLTQSSFCQKLILCVTFKFEGRIGEGRRDCLLDTEEDTIPKTSSLFKNTRESRGAEISFSDFLGSSTLTPSPDSTCMIWYNRHFSLRRP